MEQATHKSADVCIIGAGFGGIAAANRLRERGREVVVIEARDRVGGRVWNRTASDGTTVSVGGTWLGRRQHRMFELCKQFGMETYPQYEQGDALTIVDGSKHRYKGLIPNLNLFALAGIGLGFWQLNQLVKRVPVDAPWKAPNAERLDSQTLGEWLNSGWNVPTATARTFLRTAMTTLFCVDPDEVSLLGSMVLARGGGAQGFQYYADATYTETHLLDGGSPELATRFAAKLGDALQLSSPVRRISQNADSVEVQSDRVTVRAKRAVVATPPLLASRIEYEPMLPPMHAELARRFIPGSIIRGITIYDEPFWREDGLTGMAVAPDLPVKVALDQTPRSGTPGIISSYLLSKTAIDLSRIDAAERRDIWLRSLAARYGERALTPVAHLETDWSAEEWSLGGMIAHFEPGVLTQYGSVLREPAGRIHWAGAERAGEMHGLMEGAVRSGESEADRIMQLENWT
jgi:monoamine oxidase